MCNNELTEQELSHVVGGADTLVVNDRPPTPRCPPPGRGLFGKGTRPASGAPTR
jgi:bacteriocin-like protein